MDISLLLQTENVQVALSYPAADTGGSKTGSG